MNRIKPYAFLGIITSLYAILLNTKPGKSFAKEQTWVSVVLGTSLVLGVVRLVMPKEEWRKLALAFVVAGLPMISRSVYNKMT